jgi:hypothetical protein
VTHCSYSTEIEEVIWRPPHDPTPGSDLGRMRAEFSASPDRRSLLSIALQGQSWAGALGHLSIRETQAGASVRIPIPDHFVAHTVDLTFIPRSGELSDVIIFRSIAFTAVPPVIDPGP